MHNHMKNDAKTLKMKHDEFIRHLGLGKSEINVYAKVNQKSQTVNGYVYEISLLTDAMIEVDRRFMETKGNNVDYYTPYVYEFISDEINDDQISDKLNSNKWLCAKIYYNGHEKIPDSITGHTLFIASPFKYSSCKLLFVNPGEAQCQKIDGLIRHEDDFINYIKCAVLEPVSDMSSLIDLFKQCNQYVQDIAAKAFKVRVYNVGQANCQYIRTTNSKERIMFDPGFTCNPNKDNVKNYLSLTKPKILIVSHWHLDHIIGVNCLRDKDFPEILIGPDFTNLAHISQSAKRLAMYFNVNNKLLLIGDCFAGKIVCINNGESANYNIKLFRGCKIDSHNNGGLILEIKGNILLPGDCEYSAWPDILQSNFKNNCYKCLLVPHHGARMAVASCVQNRPDDNLKLAIISYGNSGREKYGHPNCSHMRDLLENGYKLCYTPYFKYLDIYHGL